MNKQKKREPHPLLAQLKDFEENGHDFSLKIGGTFYEVSTHFNSKGNQSVLDQFKTLILSENLI